MGIYSIYLKNLKVNQQVERKKNNLKKVK